jgi:antitoxin component of RelBE/YafQ-DinJ toxin-antitoxin module
MLFNMVIKTFNVDSEAYDKFSKYCKENGISMSKQVTIMIKAQIEEEPQVREEYLRRLEKLRKEPSIKVDLRKRYGIK